MKKYTYNDWLYDKIDFKILGQNIMEISSGLLTLKNQSIISEKDYEQIITKQEEAFDIALKVNESSFIKSFETTFNKSPYPEEYLTNEIDRIEEILNQNKDQLNQVLAGNKDTTRLKGSLFREIIKQRDLLTQGERSESYIMEINSIRITSLHKYKSYLKSIQNKQHKHFSKYLIHPNREKFAEMIREEFPTETHRAIRVLLEVLTEMEYFSVLPGEFNNMLKGMKKYFNRDLGTYQSIQNIKSENIHEQDKKPVRARINFILRQLEEENR